MLFSNSSQVNACIMSESHVLWSDIREFMKLLILFWQSMSWI